MDVKTLIDATTFWQTPPHDRPYPLTVGEAFDRLSDDYIRTLLAGGNPFQVSIDGKFVYADANKLVGFYKFMFDRHDIWHRRFVLEQRRPWTLDPILSVWKFTNVWRQLDRGTVYLLDHLNDQSRLNYRHCLSDFWNIMHYRLFNNWEAHKALGGFVAHEDFNYDEWYKRLRDRWKAGHTVLCTAHNTCVYSGFPGDDKVERVCLIAKRVHETAQDTLDRVFDCRKLEDVFKVINSVKGYGPFLSYEVVSDVLYTGLTPFNVNDWANAGPGAINGLGRIFGEVKKHQYLPMMQWLRENQDVGFEAVKRTFGLDFKQIAWQGRELDLRCIEHQLCEYSKIVKLYQGTGRNFSGHVKPIDRGPADLERMRAAF